MDFGFIFSFSAGILSVVSPCVIPLIPIVIGYSILRRSTREVTAFIIGFFLVFAILTILTVIFTAAINYYLFYFRVLAAILIIAMGISFILKNNFFNFSYAPQHRNQTVGSFLAGFFTCLAWSPCYGPYIIAIAAYSASTGNWIYSAANMMLFAAGFSLALLAIGLTTSKINIKRFMKYSDVIRIVSGIVIIIAGIYLLMGYLRFIVD